MSVYLSSQLRIKQYGVWLSWPLAICYEVMDAYWYTDRTMANLQQNMSRNIHARLCVMLFCTNVQCLGVCDVLSWYYQGSRFNIAMRVSTRNGGGRCYLTDLSSLSILYHPRNEVVGVYIGFTPSVLPPVRPPIGLTCSVTPTVRDGFFPY